MPLNVSVKNKILIVLAVGVVVFGADQYTKSLVIKDIAEHQIIPVIDGFFNLTLRYNTGAAFSLFSSMSLPFFIIISAAAVGMLLFFAVQLEDEKLRQYIALGFILGGAAGNLFDRISMGGVADFLLFYYKSFSWPAFNVADIAIVCGVFVFLYENSILKKIFSKDEKIASRDV